MEQMARVMQGIVFTNWVTELLTVFALTSLLFYCEVQIATLIHNYVLCEASRVTKRIALVIMTVVGVIILGWFVGSCM